MKSWRNEREIHKSRKKRRESTTNGSCLHLLSTIFFSFSSFEVSFSCFVLNDSKKKLINNSYRKSPTQLPPLLPPLSRSIAPALLTTSIHHSFIHFIFFLSSSSVSFASFFCLLPSIFCGFKFIGFCSSSIAVSSSHKHLLLLFFSLSRSWIIGSSLSIS